jgi:hypothetical protein
MKLKEICP